MFRHLSNINFAMYVLAMSSLKEVIEENYHSKSRMSRKYQHAESACLAYRI